MPNAEHLRATTWFWNGPFSYFFTGQSLPGRLGPESSDMRLGASSDYCVIYINQRQRGRLPRELLDYVDGMEPVKVVQIQGLEYARIYDLRKAPLPAYLRSAGGRSP